VRERLAAPAAPAAYALLPPLSFLPSPAPCSPSSPPCLLLLSTSQGITAAAGTYQGPCVPRADRACAADVTPGRATCVALAGDSGFAEVPSSCYASRLFGEKGTAMKGQKTGCIGEAALSVFNGTPCVNPSNIRCFADPCTVSTCSVEGALCAANYCERIYRGVFLPASCSAVWLDPATGNLIESCMAPLP
jgi:hypothetical protein